MEDGGIAHRLKDNSAFWQLHVWQKCWLLLFERLFQLEPFGLAYLVIETDAEEDAVLLVAVGGVFAMNEPDE